MADETLLLQLDVGGDSTEAQVALQEVSDHLSSLQSVVSGIDPSRLEAVGPAGDTAAAGASAAGEAAEGTAGSLDAAAAGASSAEGGFSGLGGATGDLIGKLGGVNQGLGFMSGILEQVSGLMGRLATGPVGFAALATVGVGAFIDLGGAAADYYNELMHLMAVTGMTKHETEIWSTAMEIAGGSSGILERAALRLSSTLQEMSQGSVSPAATALRTLGIQATDSQGNLRSFGDVMPELIEKLTGLTDKTEQSAMIADIFGNRFAIQLVPLITNYGYVMERATQIENSFASAQGDVTRLILEYNAAQAQLNETYEAFFTRVGPPFIAILSGIAEGMLAITDSISLADQALGFFGTSLRDVIAQGMHLGSLQAPFDFRDVLSGDIEKFDDLLLHISGTEVTVDIAKRSLGGLASGIGSLFGKGSDSDEALKLIADDEVLIAQRAADMQRAAHEHLIAIADDIDILKNRAATAGSGFETFRSQVESAMEGTKEAISGVLPSVKEDFAAWSERLHEMAIDYANFKTNLEVILNALVQAHVENPERIIVALEEAGPQVTAAMAENLAQGGVKAITETLADLSTITSTSIEDATNAVLKQTPSWKARWAATGNEIGAALGQGVIDGMAALEAQVEAEAAHMLELAEQALHGSPEYVTYHWGEEMAYDLVRGFGSVAAMESSPGFSLTPSWESLPLPTIRAVGGPTTIIHAELHVHGAMMGSDIEARRFARQMAELILQERSVVPAP